VKTERTLRCAIYTRKSSEEGLEQSFNSLQAQREACEAYVKSQAQEGWRALKAAYDDGGFSGGSMERPGLKQLLADIEQKRIDVVVVYKVDRLTRSLMDFAKIVEVLDRHGVSFVSVTQHFNTTSSMGRLTLNVLLSFAQFEREVTGERIRDKFLASRKKGMWMGGQPPLGYDIKARRLVVNEPEADQVRLIFEGYVKLGSVAALKADLERRGIRSKRWQTHGGAWRGGAAFSRGALYTLLQNRAYLGQAVHKGVAYPGEHSPLVPAELWAEVNARLAANRHERSASRAANRSALAGLLYDDRGHPMTPTHTRKADGRRYCYYVSQALLQSRPEDAGSVPRVAASAIEALVDAQLGLLASGSEAARSKASAPGIQRMRAALRRVEVHVSQVRLSLDDRVVSVPIRMRRHGHLTAANVSPADQPTPNRPLLKAVARAWRWREALVRGQVKTLGDLAVKEGYTERYVRCTIQLAFLAPDLLDAIVAGRQPRWLELKSLRDGIIPLSWTAQRERVRV
jgi:DNA invertase Pin-like site-specific DNA recombinase